MTALMNKSACFLAKASLSFVWIATGITSVFFAQEIGYEVLARGGITGPLATLAIYSGSLVDVVVGLWLLSGKALKLCYLVQALVMLTYTLLLTFIDASFWLHPFGPLTKNMPLLALVYLLYQAECANPSHQS